MVRDLDAFRAPPSEAEVARRRAAGLTPAQDAHLLRWGYPVRLRGVPLPHDADRQAGPCRRRSRVEAALGPRAGGGRPRPFVIRSCDARGRGRGRLFHELHRYTLSG